MASKYGVGGNQGKPTLAACIGDGPTADITINAHIHAPEGINPWAGTDGDGMPIPCDGGSGWTRGWSADHLKPKGGTP